MRAMVTILADDGRHIVRGMTMDYPPTAEQKATFAKALRLACTTTLRPATLCDCLEDRETGKVTQPCERHARQEARAS